MITDFRNLACAGVLLTAASAAEAAMVQNISFLGEGVVTTSRLDFYYCDDEDCWDTTPESFGYPSVGTPFTLSGTIQFAQPVPATGLYFFEAWDDMPELSFTGTLSLTIAGYPNAGWSYGWYADGFTPDVWLENKRPDSFFSFVEGCAGLQGVFSSGGLIDYSYHDCGNNYEYIYVLGAEGSITYVWADGVELRVPEPATWALLIAGFGMVGAAIRQRRTQLQAPSLRNHTPVSHG